MEVMFDDSRVKGMYQQQKMLWQELCGQRWVTTTMKAEYSIDFFEEMVAVDSKCVAKANALSLQECSRRPHTASPTSKTSHSPSHREMYSRMTGL